MDSKNRPDAGTGFLVDDFINAFTAPLDRVQDALRLKAVNRPLTYALRELHLELKVFVDLDAQGQVRLRPAGANEQGASAMTLDFTTVTKPMMEENTISMSAARSTPLDALGLEADERQRLERMGVTTLAQLNRLGAATASAVARLADLPVERLRSALQRRASPGSPADRPQVPARPCRRAPTAPPPSNHAAPSSRSRRLGGATATHRRDAAARPQSIDCNGAAPPADRQAAAADEPQTLRLPRRAADLGAAPFRRRSATVRPPGRHELPSRKPTTTGWWCACRTMPPGGAARHPGRRRDNDLA